jgi:hypothetical protein
MSNILTAMASFDVRQYEHIIFMENSDILIFHYTEVIQE